MKVVYSLSVSLLIFLIVAETTISFKPFHVSFNRLPLAIGTLLIIAGMMFIEYQGRLNGRALGKNDVMEILKEYESTNHKQTP